jgi:hypothetical protein
LYYHPLQLHLSIKLSNPVTTVYNIRSHDTTYKFWYLPVSDVNWHKLHLPLKFYELYEIPTLEFSETNDESKERNNVN